MSPPAPAAPPPAPPEETLRRRLMGALVLRLAVATLLLGGTLLFAVDGSRGYSAFTPASLIALITATYAISGLSAGLLASGATRGALATPSPATLSIWTDMKARETVH